MSTSTPNALLKIAGLVVLCAAGVVWQAPRSASAESAPTTAPTASTPEERLAVLEKIVLRNTDKPDATILARLDRIEKLLQLDAKETREHVATDAKTFDDLKASVIKAERDQDALDRRLREMERLKLDKANTDVGAEVRDMKRDLDGLKSSLRDLQDRMRRQEQR
jgi:hypothetical protein